MPLKIGDTVWIKKGENPVFQATILAVLPMPPLRNGTPKYGYKVKLQDGREEYWSDDYIIASAPSAAQAENAPKQTPPNNRSNNNNQGGGRKRKNKKSSRKNRKQSRKH